MKETKLDSYLWNLPFINIVAYLLMWGAISHHFIWMAALISVIIISRVFHIRIDLGKSFGRRSVITTFILTVLFIVYALWDKSVQAGTVMYFVLSWLPVFFFPLLIKDLFNGKNVNDEAFPELRKPTPFSKSPPERPNFNRSRWFSMAFSYPLNFSAMNAVYPRAIYALSIWGSVLYCVPNDYPKALYIALVLSGLLSLVYFKTAMRRRVKEWFFYIMGGVIFAVAIFAGLAVFQSYMSKMSYSWMSKTLSNGWFNNTYSSTQIGKDEGFDDGQELLMRTIWAKRANDLLPASYFNLFMDNSWTVSANFVSGKTLDVNSGTVIFPASKDIPLLDLKSFNPIAQDKKSSKFNFADPTVPMTSQYKENLTKEQMDKRIILTGQVLKNQRGLTAIPIPSSSKYLIGENGNGRFSKYSNGSVVFTKNNSLVNWQVIYDETKYLPLHVPVVYDMSYPKDYEQDFERLIHEANISKSDSADIIARKLAGYFQSKYTYTLDLKNKDGQPRSMHDFMTDDKRGHCEFFATTTTLVMRYLGIPTRYTVGFLVNEAHPEEEKDMYWVRKKDAHSWAVYWNGEGWKTLDTTPYSSAEWEKPWYYKMANSFNHFQYVIDNLDVDTIKEVFDIKVLGLIVFILGGVLIIIYRKRAAGRAMKQDEFMVFYVEGEEEEKLREEFKEILLEYPKTLGEPWLKWANRTGNENVIRRVKEYYEKIY